MHRRSDRFSFAFSLILTLLLLCFGIFAMRNAEFSPSDYLSYDKETMTLTVGDEQYAPDPTVLAAVTAADNAAKNTADAFVPTPIRKAAEGGIWQIRLAVRRICGGIASIFSLFIRGNM